jgi:methylenetetrahydrofolate reductase (NADPH)
MKFAEQFDGAKRPVISFEVFPPKTDKAMDSLRAALPRLIELDPSYMTVTYGAMGTTRVKTVEIASLIHNEHGLECACHLTCVGATKDQIEAQLEHIARRGIENIVALRGDPPRGQETFVAVEGGFSYANELVEFLREDGRFGVAVAGYPEKHTEAPDMATDLANLKRKVDAGGDVVITQLFYDNADFFRFVDSARELGIDKPIVPGLLPIQSLPQIERLAGMCGASIPDALRARLGACGEDAEAARDVGADWCLDQSRDLLERGAPGIHYYVLNRARQMERIIGELRR